MKNYVVLFREPEMHPLTSPYGFSCFADNADHAEEQCKNAYPECEVVWVWQGPVGLGIDLALQEYWGNL